MAAIKTLSDLIHRDDRYDVNKITFYGTTEDQSLVIAETNLFQIYHRFITPYISIYEVSQAERDYYRFKPYVLSLDLYDTPSLGWMILYLNDKECASKFYIKQTIRLIEKDDLPEVYETIATKSSTNLQQNWNTYLKLVGENVP